MSWQEEFDKEFVDLEITDLMGNAHRRVAHNPEKLKAFVTQALAAQRQSDVEKIRGYRLTCGYLPGNPNQNKLIAAWKRGVEDRQAALEDAIKTIKEETNEPS